MNNGIRFPKVHIAESARQRILATFEELGGYVPGVQAGLPGAIPEIREPSVPGVGVAGGTALDVAAAPGASLMADPVGSPGVEAAPSPAALQAGLSGVMTGGNLVDTLAGGA